MTAISKSFDGIEVLHAVAFDVRPGEVHALVGENGAGKSTLMKIAAGVHQPSTGTMAISSGQPPTANHELYSPKSPSDALKAGIAMVHQELSLAPDVSIAENILAGREPLRAGMVRWHELYAKAQAMMSEFGLNVPPDAPVSSLGIGYRQVVEILKALASDPRVVIFDEPTSSLEAHESALVLATIRRLAERGIAVVYISHRMDEVFKVSDRVTVLRDGNLVATKAISETALPEVVNAMVGRALTDLYPDKAKAVGEELLRVEGLVLGGKVEGRRSGVRGPGSEAGGGAGSEPLSPAPEERGVGERGSGGIGGAEGVSFVLCKGEIVGFSGLVGSGRTEVMRAIFGANKMDSGTLTFEGRPLVGKPQPGTSPPSFPPNHKRHTTHDIRHWTVSDAMAAGIAYVPEERKALGLFLDRSVEDNLACACLFGKVEGRGSKGEGLRSEVGKEIASEPLSPAPEERGVGERGSGSGDVRIEGRALKVEGDVAAGLRPGPGESKVEGRKSKVASRRFRPRELAEDYSRRLSIKARDVEQEVSGLSGGNQQKVLLARWMATQPKVLIVDEPTRGVDIGAKGEIHRMLRAYAEGGAGVIVVSSEMPELLGLCDRILVMREGRIVGEVQGPSMTEERLIELAMGRG
jgi:ABC-type sugar transport system ATPase subunit